jgi:hypothetical protein
VLDYKNIYVYFLGENMFATEVQGLILLPKPTHPHCRKAKVRNSQAEKPHIRIVPELIRPVERPPEAFLETQAFFEALLKANQHIIKYLIKNSFISLKEVSDKIRVGLKMDGEFFQGVPQHDIKIIILPKSTLFYINNGISGQSFALFEYQIPKKAIEFIYRNKHKFLP